MFQSIIRTAKNATNMEEIYLQLSFRTAMLATVDVQQRKKRLLFYKSLQNVYMCFNLNNLSTCTFVAPGQNVNSNSYIKYNNYSNIFVVVILKQNKMLLHLSSNKRETQST